MAQVLAATAATAAIAPATAQTWAYRRAHTRGDKGYATYGKAGVPGVAFFASSMLAEGATWPATLAVTPGGSTLTYCGTAACGRRNYRIPGVSGTLQVAAGWFAAGPAPATLGITGVAFAAAVVGQAAAKVTSAVVAAANVAQAAVTGAAVATPPQVAAVATVAASAVVAAAKQAAATVVAASANRHARRAAAAAAAAGHKAQVA